MNPKILITGPPRSGKSSLIVKIIDYFTKKHISIYGFLTPEVRESNQRIGFDVEEIHSKKRKKLARINGLNSEYRLGKYSVYLNGLELFISRLENIKFTEDSVIIIDEIGKMELFSGKFRDFINQIFTSKLQIIATIGLGVKFPFKEDIYSHPDVKLLTLDRKNFLNIFQTIISTI